MIAYAGCRSRDFFSAQVNVISIGDLRDERAERDVLRIRSVIATRDSIEISATGGRKKKKKKKTGTVIRVENRNLAAICDGGYREKAI